MRSSLLVLEAAESYDLTVLETVKLECGIDNNEKDTLLAAQIHQASDAIAGECKRVFAKETVRETFRLGRGFRLESAIESLSLRRFPVSEILSVKEDGIDVDSSEYELEDKAGLLYRFSATGNQESWGWGFNFQTTGVIQVEYTGGYELLAELPFNLERACVLLVKSFYADSLRSNPLIKVEDVPDVMRQEYFDNSKETALPSNVLRLLKPFIKVAVG